MARYLTTERPPIICQGFNPGDVVTMSVVDMLGNPVAINNPACLEIHPGIFVWQSSELTNPIPVTGITKYLFVMNNGIFDVVDAHEFGGYPDRLIGIAQENVYIDQTVYDPVFGGLESARLRIYADGYTLGGATGVIATYQITSVATGIGQFSYWKMAKL